MHNITNEELFTAIISSNVLVSYSAQDPDLVELLEKPDHPNIHYPQSYAPAKQIVQIFRRRLEYMASQGISLNFEAIEQLVAFVEEYPEGQIYNVTFNCAKQHYGVSCGVSQKRVHVICAMAGGHIPDELFGETTK